MAKQRNTQGGGRKPTDGQGVISRTVALLPSQWERLDDEALKLARRAGKDAKPNVSHVLRNLLADYQANKSKAETHARRLVPLLGAAPCGPLREAINEARLVDLGDAYKTLNVRGDDFLIEASGFSMVSDDFRRHIPDGAWVLMDPLLEPEGRNCLCRVETASGDVLWTIKTYHRDNRNVIHLRNGEKQDIELPADTISIRPIAAQKAVITSHLDTSDAEIKSSLNQLSQKYEVMARKVDEAQEDVEEARRQVQEAQRGYPEAFARVADEMGWGPERLMQELVSRVVNGGTDWLWKEILGTEDPARVVERQLEQMSHKPAKTGS